MKYLVAMGFCLALFIAPVSQAYHPSHFGYLPTPGTYGPSWHHNNVPSGPVTEEQQRNFQTSIIWVIFLAIVVWILFEVMWRRRRRKW